MSKLADIALRRSLIDGSVTVADADWLIARVRKLETALRGIKDYDRTDLAEAALKED